MCCYAISILLIQFFVTPCIHALGILLPLYVSPGANCAAWSPVFDAIFANANTQWYIIINPDSGPGSFDQLYETCVSKLPASANQITMGYVDTKGGNVLGDIDTYAGWPSSSRPHGIFFDRVSPTTNQLSTYQGYVSHAKFQGFTFIGLDPGQTVADSYFSIADLINTYEDSYSSFNSDSLSGTISKQSVILVNSPTTGSYSTVISQLESKDVVAVYISTVSDSSSDLPTQLSKFASEVASVGGGETSSGSTGTASGSTGSTGSTGPTSSIADPGTNPGSTPSGSNSESGPPIAAIIVGVLGALIIVSIPLAIFLCTWRRHRPSASPEAATPFTAVRSTIFTDPGAAFTKGSTISEVAPPQFWNDDAKAPVTAPVVESTSGENATVADMNLSVWASYSTLPLFAAPLGPPPSYHN
ncbi:Spherulation-specific family 4-domain-containing protein [Mycena albidolilacea]|uniref:Spherulation-specific family 4-domain-containing protein n=1 Tax=Mycena albidolilacea TaxID=1033008 RepID=A0AAD6ZK49_9AGAR|nr:Spherulation-specific family 4-domain-containing protein [Mycena albidolilacea]